MRGGRNTVTQRRFFFELMAVVPILPFGVTPKSGRQKSAAGSHSG